MYVHVMRTILQFRVQFYFSVHIDIYIGRQISGNRPESMSHDIVRVKAEDSVNVDTDLGVVTTEEGGQSVTLSSVHQQEHHVMVLDQLLQSLHLLGHLVFSVRVCVCVCVCVCARVRNSSILFRLIRSVPLNRVSRHWDDELHQLSVHSREDNRQPSLSHLRLS